MSLILIHANIIEMFDSGKFLFILDGYDEIFQNIKEYILKDIEDFIVRFPKNNYLITTRPYTDVTRLVSFTNFEICGLDPDLEINPFIIKQLFNNKALADSIIVTLQESSSKKYIPLLTNPLFLILFLNSYESYPKLPPKKSTFYWRVFDAVYEKHETYSKGGYRRPKVSELNREKFEFVLNSFSLVSYFQGKFNFDEPYLEATLRVIKKEYELSFESNNFIEDLKITLSLLIEDGNTLSFSHRTLQEYFTAKYLNTLDEVEKFEFLKRLACQQIANQNHTFLLELISELYPSEYGKYFIPEYINPSYRKHSF